MHHSLYRRVREVSTCSVLMYDLVTGVIKRNQQEMETTKKYDTNTQYTPLIVYTVDKGG